jgi:hypothetical protein
MNAYSGHDSIPAHQVKDIATQIAKEIVAGLSTRTGDDETKLDKATRFTQSVFSELRYALGSRNVDGSAARQRLTSKVVVADSTYTITYHEDDLPAEVDHYDLIYRGGDTITDKDIVVTDGKATITLPNEARKPNPLRLLAVRLKKSTGADAEVILLSFVLQPIVQASF